MTVVERLRRLGWAQMVVRLVAGLLVAELVYLLLANMALSGGLAERWASSRPGLTVSFDSAWTVVPGRMHVRELELVSHGSRGDASITAKSAELDLDLLAALGRRLHADDVEAEGVRVRLSGKQGNELRQRAFPAIRAAGLFSRGAHPVRLEDLRANLEEIWLLEYRYLGPARLGGDIALGPEEGVALDELSLELGPGELRFGPDRVIARDLAGSVEASGVLSDVSERAWKNFSGAADLRGRLETLDFVSAYLMPRLETRVAGGAGALELTARVEDGKLLPGSRVAFRTNRLLLERAPLLLSGRAVFEIAVAEAVPALDLAYHDVVVSVSGERSQHPPPRISAIAIHVTASSADLSERWSLSGAVGVPTVRLPELAWLNALRHAGADWKVHSGRAELALEGKLQNGKERLVLRVVAKAEDAHVEVGEVSVRSDAIADFEIVSADAWPEQGLIRDATLKLEEATVTSELGETRDWSMLLASERMKYRGLLPHALDGQLRVKLESFEPVLKALGAADEIPAFAAKLLVLPNLAARGELHYAPGIWDVRLHDARSGLLSTEGRWRREKGRGHAAFLVRGGPLAVGLEVEQDTTRVRMLADSKWLDERLERFPD